MAALPLSYHAAVYERLGPIEETLKIKHLPLEPLLPNDVRIKVHAAALNPIDHLVAEKYGDIYTGKTPSEKESFRLGWDVAGEVVELGTDAVGQCEIGDNVYAMTPPTRFGTISEFTTIDAQYVVPMPKTLDFVHAAAAPLVSITSYMGILEITKLQRSERILVVGGSTATGIVAIQLAKMIGAYVIATASTTKLEFVQSIGADEVIDYTTTKWSDVIAPHSLDVFYDCAVDPSAWETEAQFVLKKVGSRFATLLPNLPASAPKFQATRLDVWARPTSERLDAITTLIDKGLLKPVIDSVFPFEKTLEAVVHLKTGSIVGKVVIEMP